MTGAVGELTVTLGGSVLAEAAETGRSGLLDAGLPAAVAGARIVVVTAAALAGADVADVLDAADALADTLDQDSPALLLGALLGSAAADGHDTVLLTDPDPDSGTRGPGAGTLVAEPTGKRGRGLLPVVIGTVAPSLAGTVPGGGAAVGAFLQFTGAVAHDHDVPGRDFTFAGLQAAQATQAAQGAEDYQALSEHGRPVFGLHLTDRSAGIGQLLEAMA